MASIVPVVEGPGDVDAFPILLRRVLYESMGRYDLSVAQPKDGKGKQNLRKKLGQYLQYAARTEDSSAILVLLDADDECPKDDLAPQLVEVANQLGLAKPIAFVCANREYEAWFLASLATIRGERGVSGTASVEGLVEDVKGVKEWLSRQMPRGRAYKETFDQAPLSQAVDLDLARQRSRSFRRLCHAVEELIAAIDSGVPVVTPQIIIGSS